MPRAAPAQGFSPSDAFGDIFGDMFGDIFGGGRRGGRSAVFRGADLRYELALDLEQAVFGTSTEIDFQTVKECTECGGSGAARGHTPVTCEACGGAGQVRISQGIFAVQQTCPRCKGRGSIIKDPCPKCAGHGRMRTNKRLSVKVPAGVDNGDRIRLAGEGEAGRNGGPPGDLYVEIVVREHPIFERDGAHLSCEVPVSFTTAALGGSVEVPTLEGQADDQGAGRHPVGPRVPPAREGHQAGARRRDRRPVLPRRGRDAGRPQRRAERTAAQVRRLARRRRQEPQSAPALLARGRAAVLQQDGRLT